MTGKEFRQWRKKFIAAYKSGDDYAAADVLAENGHMLEKYKTPEKAYYALRARRYFNAGIIFLIILLKWLIIYRIISR